MKTNRITDLIVNALDLACYLFLIAFAVFNAVLAIAALVFACAEGDAFYLVGTAAGSLLAWFIWSVGVAPLKDKTL